MQYATVERDFVTRTLAIINQYDKHVIPVIGNDNRYEVTLLLNCLLGLIILPFEYSNREQDRSKFPVGRVYPKVVPDDLRLISELGTHWGLSNLQIERLKIHGNKIPISDITLNETIALMRHSMAHTRFKDGSKRVKPPGLSVSYGVYQINPIESVIIQVNFVNEYGGTEFEASIPISGLRNFACMVAKQFLVRLEERS